jgi:hypothetical protein
VCVAISLRNVIGLLDFNKKVKRHKDIYVILEENTSEENVTLNSLYPLSYDWFINSTILCAIEIKGSQYLFVFSEEKKSQII